MGSSSGWNTEARWLEGLAESMTDKAEDVLTETAEQTRRMAKALSLIHI